MARNYVVPLGLLSLASDPTGHSAGETYYNTTSNKVRVYNGASWQDAGLQGTVGTQGVQGTQGPNAALVVSSTPPSGPLIGDRWVDSNSGSLYTWNYDGNSYSWVEFDASGYVGAQGVQGTQGTQGVSGSGTQGTQGATGTASAASPTFTGTVTLPTSTNTVAPLILPTGVLLTSPAAGVIESDGTAPYITESVTTGRSLIDTSFIATNGVYAAPLLSATSAQPLWGGFTSATGTLGTPTGTGPWTVVVTGMSATGGFIPGKTITATAGTGSFNTNTVTIVSVDSATQITVSATGGTIPTAGTVTVVKVSTTGALTLLANTAYTFEQMLYVTTGATSHTTAIGFSGTVGVGSIWHQTDSALTGVSGTIQNSGSSGLSTIAWTTLAGGVVEATTTAAQTAWRTKGMLRTTTSGTIIPQITFSAAPTAPNSLSATSFFRITPIGSNTLYNIGAWA